MRPEYVSADTEKMKFSARRVAGGVVVDRLLTQGVPLRKIDLDDPVVMSQLLSKAVFDYSERNPDGRELIAVHDIREAAQIIYTDLDLH